MKYFFLYLLLIQSMAFSTEGIYCKISDLLNPSKEDYRILQDYLSKGDRPYLSWLNKYIQDPGDGFRYDLRVRNFRLIKENEDPTLGIVCSNICPDDRDLCIISYASFNGSYPERVKRLQYNLQRVGFHGHYMYRIGGWPDVKGGSLLITHVPYSFKLCMFKEALSYGYRKILWLDTSFTPLQDLSAIFEIIEEKGYLIVSDPNKFSNYINEKVLQYFNISFEESKNIEAIAAGVIGFDFTNENAIKIFDDWNIAAFDLNGFLSSRPEQNALAAVLYRLSLPTTCKLTDICTWEKNKIKTYHLFFIGEL